MAVAYEALPTDAARPSHRAWSWIGVIALYVAVRVQLLPVPLERDEGVFGVIGQAILRGEVPYRDIFDHKPPGIHYIYALALLAVPPTAVGVHAFLLVWNLATLACVAWVTAAIAGPRAAVAAAALYVPASAAFGVQGFTASTEMVLLLPLTASLGLALTARGVPAIVASGALAGATFWIKQPALLAAGVAPLVLLVERRREPAAARALLAWSGGVVLVMLLVPLPFVLLGAWREFWYWSVTHSWLYPTLPTENYVARLLVRLGDLVRDLGATVALAVAGGAVGMATRRPRAWIALAFLLASVASAFHSPYLYKHYFALLAPAVAIAGGAGIDWLASASGTMGTPVAAGFLAIALAVPIATRPWFWLRPDPVGVSIRALGKQGYDAAPMVAAYLRAHTTPDERIFVYGSEAEISFTAERRDVNPFGASVYPLTWNWPRHREFQEHVWAEMERWRPVYMVNVRTPTSFIRSPDMDPFLEQHLNEIAEHAYRMEAIVVATPAGGWEIVPWSSRPAADEGLSAVLYELWRRVPPSEEDATPR